MQPTPERISFSIRRFNNVPSHGVCLACALSQSLKNEDLVLEQLSPTGVTFETLIPFDLSLPFSDFCLATSKRGPPTSLFV